MPTLDIGGQRVQVGDEFLSLPPEQQQATVEEIAGKLPKVAAPGASASPVSANDVVRSAATGVPVVGGALNTLNAATNAVLAPVLNPLFNEKDQLKGTLAERYARSKEMQDAQDKKFAEEHPVIDTTAKIGGAIAGTAPLIAAAPAAFGVGGAGLVPSMAAGAASGAGLSAADAAVRGEDPTRAAMFGAGGGAAAPLIGKAVGAVASKLVNQAEKAAPTTDELYTAADRGFDAVRNSGVQIKPEAIQSLSQKVRGGLHDDGLRDYLAPKTFAALKELESPANLAPASDAKRVYDELIGQGVNPERAKAAVAGLKGAETTSATEGATFADLHGMRRVLGKAAGSPDPTERMAASRAIKALDEYLADIPKDHVLAGDAAAASAKFKDALGNYAAAKRADVVAGKMEAADLQAATANSGQNIDNATRQRIKDILKSPKLRRGFSQDEVLQMQQVARGTAPANIVRAIGNLLGGGGGLGALVSGGAGFAAAGPAGVAAPIAGFAMKKLGNALTAREAAKLDQMIRMRAPAAAAADLENQLIQTTNAAKRAQLQRLISALSSSATQAPLLPGRSQPLPLATQ